MYFKVYHLLTLFTGIFGHIPQYEDTTTQTDISSNIYEIHDKAVKSVSKFGKLLNTIASMNEERLKALKRYTQLDKYNIANGILRIADGKLRDPMVAVMLINKKNSRDNKLYEIFDAEEVNTYGNTPIRNIIQRIKDHYIEVENIETDSVSSSSESEFDLEEILSNYKYNIETPYREHVERHGKRNSDTSETEEINSNENEASPINKRKETSDGEEISSIKNKTTQIAKKLDDDDGEEITKNKSLIIKTMKAHIKDVVKQSKETDKQSKVSKDPSSQERSDDEVIVHGNEKVKLSDIKKDKKHILRLFKKCNKAAMRRCNKACKRAIKEICDSYKCSRGMKRSAKKNCKTECKDYFTYRR